MPELKNVKSSNVEAVGYDPTTQELHVRYRSGGRVYIHEGVPPEIGSVAHEQESVGKYLHSKVRSAFKLKVEDKK